MGEITKGPETCKLSESLYNATHTISGIMTSEERGREKAKEGKRRKRRGKRKGRGSSRGGEKEKEELEEERNNRPKVEPLASRRVN